MNICSSTYYHGIFTPISTFHLWIQSVLDAPLTTTLRPIITTTMKPSFVYPCNRSYSCGCAYSDVRFSSSDSEIVEDSIAQSWSMVVSLQRHGTGEHLCTGTLISNSYVLTTAECVQLYPSFNISVQAGVTNLSDGDSIRRTVKQIFIHPSYSNSPKFINNIAVLQLNRPFIFTNNPVLNRICIDRSNDSLPMDELPPKNGTRVVMVGWDSVRPRNTSRSSLVLEQLQFIVKDNQCVIDNQTIPHQFCAGQSSAANTS